MSVVAQVVAGPAEQQLLDRIASDVEDGLVPSAAVHLRRGDEVLLDAVIGAPSDAMFLPYSVTKGVVNAAIATLVDDGSIPVASRVIDLLPWFDGDGKQDITVEHLLLHTAGLAGAPMRPSQGGDPEARPARIQTWRTAHVPGTACRYHPTAAHWVLAEIVESVAGVTLQELVDLKLAQPLGLEDLLLGAPADDPRIVPPVAIGEETPPEVVEQLRAQGVDLTSMLGEAATHHLLRLGDPEVLPIGIPGGGLVSSPRDVAAVLVALATGRPQLWSQETRLDFTERVRGRLHDPMVGGPSNRSLGFCVSGDDGHAVMRGLPTDLGPRVFGQFGSGGHVSWADSDSGLAFASFSSGLHRDPLWWFSQMSQVNALAAACA